jgi:hypothetical protein
LYLFARIPRRERAGVLDHFVIEIVYADKMLWPCEALLREAREIVAGGLCPPLSDNLKVNML